MLKTWKVVWLSFEVTYLFEILCLLFIHRFMKAWLEVLLIIFLSFLGILRENGVTAVKWVTYPHARPQRTISDEIAPYFFFPQSQWLVCALGPISNNFEMLSISFSEVYVFRYIFCLEHWMKPFVKYMKNRHYYYHLASCVVSSGLPFMSLLPSCKKGGKS